MSPETRKKEKIATESAQPQSSKNRLACIRPASLATVQDSAKIPSRNHQKNYRVDVQLHYYFHRFTRHCDLERIRKYYEEKQASRSTDTTERRSNPDLPA